MIKKNIKGIRKGLTDLLLNSTEGNDYPICQLC